MSCPYNIGDIGPGGGIVFSVPGYAHTVDVHNSQWPISITNNTVYYYEMGPEIDGAAAKWNTRNNSTCKNQFQGLPVTINTSPPWGVTHTGAVTPGSEFGGNNGWIGTSTLFGAGFDNTQAITALPSGGGVTPPNPVFDVNNIAAELAIANNFSGFNDWFIPSIQELNVMLQEVGSMISLPTGLPIPTSMQLPTQQGLTSAYVSSNPLPGQPSSMQYQGSPWYKNEYWSSSERGGGGGYGFKAAFSSSWDGSFVRSHTTYRCHTRPVRIIRRFECPPSGIEYNWRFGKTGMTLNIGSAQTNNTMYEGGMYDPGGAYLSVGAKFGDPNDTPTSPLQVGLNPLSTQLIPNRQVADPAVWNNSSWINDHIRLFHLQTNMADSLSGLTVVPNKYHITVWDSQENLRGKWKYGLGTGSGTWSPSIGCGAQNPCYRYWLFHFISHLAGDPQVIPQHGDFLKIEYEKEYSNNWSAWHAPTIQQYINTMLVYGHPNNQTPYTQAAFNAWSLPNKPFSNSANLVNYANTGTDIRFNSLPIPFWRECIDSCTSPSYTNNVCYTPGVCLYWPSSSNPCTPACPPYSWVTPGITSGNGCRDWFPQRPPMLAPPFGAHILATPGPSSDDCCDGVVMPSPTVPPCPPNCPPVPPGGSSSKLSAPPPPPPNGICIEPDIERISAFTTKATYTKDDNQKVTITPGKNIEIKK